MRKRLAVNLMKESTTIMLPLEVKAKIALLAKKQGLSFTQKVIQILQKGK